MALVPKTSDEWLEAIHREFGRESDRAAGIVACAMLDEALRLLIERRLVKPEKPEFSILDGDRAPLGTFNARINAAHQLGLISSYLARDLHLMRKIRNELAHHPLERTFSSPEIRDRVTVLEKGSDYNQRLPSTRSALGPAGPRWDFLGVAAWILYSLHVDIASVTPVTAHGPEFGYIDWNSLPQDVWDALGPEVRRTLQGG